MAPPPPSVVRAMARRFVATPSVSPDVHAETAMAQAVRESLPPAIEHGEWFTADGRPVVWAHVRGSSAADRPTPAVLLLGHYDTVGVEEYRALEEAERGEVAFDSGRLREALLRMPEASVPADVRADLEQERAAPGTWFFGRGALDMKSGLAAGIAALGSLAADEALRGDVLFVACPDEEHASAGMLAAIPEIAARAERERLTFAGALNLDYSARPAAYAGVMGKHLAGLYVLGRPTHAGTPFEGVDAAQLAAAIVARATSSRALVDTWHGRAGVPPVALRLRDLKPAYNVQTALEAEVELNLLTFERSLADSLEALRGVAREALDDLLRSMAELERWTVPDDAKASVERDAPAGEVLLWSELAARAGIAEALFEDSGADARAATLARIRGAATTTGLRGPAVVIHLLPPFHPHAAPGEGPLVAATRRVLGRESLDVVPFYPYITDASYVAWRAEPAEVLATLMPSYGREYRLPVEAMRALDLDVVNLGPWGRDAHGPHERADARWAFETLPKLVSTIVRETLGAAGRANLTRDAEPLG